MKTLESRFGGRIFTVCFALLALLLADAAGAAEVKRLALIPFKVNADEDLSYLRDGINDMLATRLSQSEEVTVVPRMEVEQAVKAAGAEGAVDESTARAVGRSLSADYVMTGSLTVLGGNVSIDAKMIDVLGRRPTMSYFEQSESLGGVITRINAMAADINSKLFGRPAASTRPTGTAGQQTMKKERREQPDPQAHPEKLLTEGRGLSDAEGGSPFIMSEESTLSVSRYWKSPTFRQPLHGLALGDVDRDGNVETVLITDHAVMIYGKTPRRFHKIAEIDEGDSHNLVGVDVADINDNGTAEIFVTSLTPLRRGLNSFVLEYDGKNFVKIVEDARWYFRVVEPSPRGKVLIGQPHRRKDAFAGSLQELSWQGGGYVARDNIPAPGEVNALGVAMGDIVGDRQEYLVAFKKNDHLRIIDGAGKIVWTGADRLGGSNLYYLIPMRAPGDVGTRRYYPMRPLVRNLPGGGEPEVIVGHNFEVAGMKLEQFRKFTGGQIEAYAWDGMGLAEKWRTRKLSGFVRSFAVGDFDNDGGDELVIVLIQSTGETVLTQPRAHIVAYDLVLPEGAEKAE